MYNYYTYNDFDTNRDKKDFIIEIINNFKTSGFFNKAEDALKYYKGENSNIMNRMQQFVGEGGCLKEDIYKANNKVPNGFYPKIVKQANGYLLSNGVNLDKEIKDNLGTKLDIKVQRAGLEANISGVAWGYVYIDKKGKFNIDMWKGKEFIPLYDERTGVLKAGIRFWQLRVDKPMYIEVYEETGVTFYTYNSKLKENVLSEGERTPYKITRSTDALEETILGEDNWSQLPIVPLFANDLKESTFNISLKNQIDLYDIVLSDFGNNLEDSQDVYWIIKNYNGQDLATFIEDYKKYKAIPVSGDGSADHKTIDVPYDARKEALQLIKTNIYDFAMACDISTIRGGSNATTTEIDAAFYDLDMKTNEFENNVVDFLEGIITLYQEYSGNTQEYAIAFTRDKLVNKKESVEMIYAAREDLDRETTLEVVLPYLGIDISKIPDILDKIDEESMNSVEIPIENQNDNDLDNNMI